MPPGVRRPNRAFPRARVPTLALAVLVVAIALLPPAQRPAPAAGTGGQFVLRCLYSPALLKG